jgi:predicted transcriptional regulator
MALEGSLKDFGLADILQLIYHQKKTGTLTMKIDSMEAKVLFENGLVVKAESSNLESLNKIGQILARSNKITEDQLKEALNTQRKSNEKIGAILIEMGAIQKEDLVKALGIHVRETVLSLFKWKEGRYSFEPSEISFERDYWLPVNTEFLIMEGVRRIDEWPFIEKKIPNLEVVFEKTREISDTIRVAKPEEDPTTDILAEEKKDKEIQITQEEMNIYNLIDGQQNVRSLIDISNMGEFETCKALSNLLTAGLITQKYALDQQIKKPDKASAPKTRFSWLSPQRLLSGFIIFICILIAVAGGLKIVQPTRETGDIIDVYRNIGFPNRLQGIGSAILVFYYRNNQLPKSLDVLSQEGYISPGIPLLKRSGEVGYEPQNDESAFILKENANPIN